MRFHQLIQNLCWHDQGYSCDAEYKDQWSEVSVNDGASAMSDHKSGVSTIIKPRAMYTHCYGQFLKLAANDAFNKSKVMKEALNYRWN